MRRTHPPYLGELELAVLDHLWARGPEEVKDVHRAIGKRRGITANTVQSALKRLHEKGFLGREKVSHAYVYSAACSREEFHRRLIGEVVELVMEGEPDAMVSAFVDLAEQAGQEHLEQLEKLVEARLRDRTRGST